MFFTCKKCKYIFETAEVPGRCPDCGMAAVRNATDDEIDQYNQYRREFDQKEETNTDEHQESEGNREYYNGDTRGWV